MGANQPLSGFQPAPITGRLTSVWTPDTPGIYSFEAKTEDRSTNFGTYYFTIVVGPAMPPPGVNPPVGDPDPAFLWLGAPSDAPEEDSSKPGQTFSAAPLSCVPVFRDWTADGTNTDRMRWLNPTIRAGIFLRPPGP